MPKTSTPTSTPSNTALQRIGATHDSLREKVAQEMRKGILSGRFQPGMRLIEERLAEDLGVSRNPIREAIRTLTSEGLVEVTARRGAVVASLSNEEADELLEVRAALEGANARLAARRRDANILARLSKILDKGSTAADEGRLQDLPGLNDQFHTELAQAGHNRILADLIKSLRDRSTPLFRQAGVAATRRSWAEHEAILRAVIAGDAELASLLAHRHVLSAGKRAGAGGDEIATPPDQAPPAVEADVGRPKARRPQLVGR
jgi:DNA-binding GntR family transcriptional regulator